MIKITTISSLIAALPLSAAVLTSLPSPLIQGSGMIHINVALNANAMSVLVQSGTPEIKPLSAWMPGDTLDPVSPWYSTLDPSQSGGFFNSQFGLVMSADSDLLPANSTIIVGWQREILPYLGYEDTTKETLKKAKPQQFGTDPKENPTRTPVLNVYFELNPEYDDYEGAPKTWRDFMAVPRPSATILLIMVFGNVDHVMAQYFSGTASDFPAPRKGRKKGCVLWVDGHASLEVSGSMFDSSRAIDHFHPERTR